MVVVSYMPIHTPSMVSHSKHRPKAPNRRVTEQRIGAMASLALQYLTICSGESEVTKYCITTMSCSWPGAHKVL